MLSIAQERIAINFDLNNDKWFYIPKPQAKANHKLYCFPHAGGTSAAYRNWIKYLSDDIELCAINLPGRGSRSDEIPNSDLIDISHDIADAIYEHTTVPFSFFGHSMGAMLAYEVVCRLRERGMLLPQHLFISARQAPHIRREVRAKVATMTDDEFYQHVIELNGISDEIRQHQELFDVYLPILKADFSAVDNWSYSNTAPLSVSITALLATKDPTTTKEDILQWQQHSKLDFYYRIFDGDHFFIQEHEKSVVFLINLTLQAL